VKRRRLTACGTEPLIIITGVSLTRPARLLLLMMMMMMMRMQALALPVMMNARTVAHMTIIETNRCVLAAIRYHFTTGFVRKRVINNEFRPCEYFFYTRRRSSIPARVAVFINEHLVRMTNYI